MSDFSNRTPLWLSGLCFGVALSSGLTKVQGPHEAPTIGALIFAGFGLAWYYQSLPDTEDT